MKTVIAFAAATLFVAAAAFGQVAEGDQHFALRAEGAQGSHAKPDHVNAAIAAYQRALAQNPNDLEARWKLLRALRFRGSYVATGNDAKKQVFAEAKKIGETGMSVLDRMLAAKGLKSVSKATEKQVADVARGIPNAGELYYWDSVVWGEWALVYGKLAAVREGVADRIKRESTIVTLIDPKIEGGGGTRVLGRLHNQTPRVPFITGWASDELSVKYLNQSLSQDPTNKITRTFLAEAMVANDSDTKPQAIQMLREVINTPNPAGYEVESAGAQADARRLLKDWGVK